MNNTSIDLRTPKDTDGLAVHSLIASCPPLDTNSSYCNLLQCSDFADTSILAERSGDIVGFVSGYRPASRYDTLFIWQVAVSNQCRGQGVALQMLEQLVKRVIPQGVRYLETTITPANDASMALFSRLFQRFEAQVESRILFARDTHFGGQHDDEVLHRAGPLTA